MPIFSYSQKKREAEISKYAMEACETIISEMGAEIHDDLIQRLTVLRYSLDRLEQSLSGNSDAEALLNTIKSEFQDVVQSVKKTSRRLLPVLMEDNSFQQNIALLCQNLETPGIGSVQCEVEGFERKINPLAETYLYRIIQELIHNSFKHSSAWHVWVRLSWQPETLVVVVEDDGTGFSKINNFIGLLRKKNNTLKMRCAIINASIRYSPGPRGLIARVVLSL